MKRLRAPRSKVKNEETQTKHRREEQLNGGHLVRSGAAMAESKQSTAFDQNQKLSDKAQKHHEMLSVRTT